MAKKFGGAAVKCCLLDLSWRAIFNVTNSVGMHGAEPQNRKGPLNPEPVTL